jgi:hypothetical protein
MTTGTKRLDSSRWPIRPARNSVLPPDRALGVRWFEAFWKQREPHSRKLNFSFSGHARSFIMTEILEAVGRLRTTPEGYVPHKL